MNNLYLPSSLPFDVAAAMRLVMREEVMPLWCNLREEQVRDKGSMGEEDWVTQADLAAEARLEPVLLNLLAGSRVIGEEAVSADRGLLAGIGEGVVWTLDPVDGTKAFKQGEVGFGMLIGLLVDGVPIAGWSLLGVEATMVAAFNGHVVIDELSPLSSPLPAGCYEVDGKMGDSRRRPWLRVQPAMDSLTSQGIVVERSCYSVGDYADLARGAVCWHGVIHDCPWDHVAGLAIVKARGGVALDLLGRPWNAGSSCGTFACMQPSLAPELLRSISSAMGGLEEGSFSSY